MVIATLEIAYPVVKGGKHVLRLWLEKIEYAYKVQRWLLVAPLSLTGSHWPSKECESVINRWTSLQAYALMTDET